MERRIVFDAEEFTATLLSQLEFSSRMPVDDLETRIWSICQVLDIPCPSAIVDIPEMDIATRLQDFISHWLTERYSVFQTSVSKRRPKRRGLKCPKLSVPALFQRSLNKPFSLSVTLPFCLSALQNSEAKCAALHVVLKELLNFCWVQSPTYSGYVALSQDLERNQMDQDLSGFRAIELQLAQAREENQILREKLKCVCDKLEGLKSVLLLTKYKVQNLEAEVEDLWDLQRALNEKRPNHTSGSSDSTVAELISGRNSSFSLIFAQKAEKLDQKPRSEKHSSYPGCLNNLV